MTFSEKLLKLRKDAGLSQEDLAEKLNVSRQAISRWEMGTAMPDCPNLLHISKQFHVSADYLLRDELEQNEDALSLFPALTVPHKAKENKVRILIGICAAIVGALGLFILRILASVFPAVHLVAVGEAHRVYDGLLGFIWVHDLKWLLLLLLAMLFGGIIGIWFPQVKGWITFLNH